MNFQQTVMFDGVDAASGHREAHIFAEAFNPIRRVFDYEDLDAKARSLVKNADQMPPHAAQQLIIGYMHGGLADHVQLGAQAVMVRVEIAHLLREALERDLATDYGSDAGNKVIHEARSYQLTMVKMAIGILREAESAMVAVA